ncbi:MAG: sugar ABC transporter substrate-binding protein, partial [Candidatus Choladocola sp.]|nr:sugar ABC transporter substrate-binding protein [Candidatus Choladocola sp.]
MKKKWMKRMISASVTAAMLVGSMSAAMVAQAEEEFDWRAYEGTTIEIQMVQHTASEAMVKKLEEFEELTGIHVEYSITPESSYFDK